MSGLVFLAQIVYVNPAGLSDLATAVKMRLGNGVATGSSALPHQSGVHFTFVQWCRTVLQGLHNDYLMAPWVLAACETVWMATGSRSGRERRLFRTALAIAVIGGLYMILLRNWSYIHDWASFYFMAPVAILGGLALNAVLKHVDRCAQSETGVPPVAGRPRNRRGFTLAGITALAAWLAVTGFRQSEAMRSQFLLLDGISSEPRNLAPDLGKALAQHFSPDTTILANFDPYGSTLPYYAQRPILNGLGTAAEWAAIMREESGPFGGVIWRDAPQAADVLAALPKAELTSLEVDGVRFTLWRAFGLRRH